MIQGLSERIDEAKCKSCGGKCCKIYPSIMDGGIRPLDQWFDEWCEGWDEQFTESGAFDTMPPQFDPLGVETQVLWVLPLPWQFRQYKGRSQMEKASLPHFGHRNLMLGIVIFRFSSLGASNPYSWTGLWFPVACRRSFDRSSGRSCWLV